MIIIKSTNNLKGTLSALTSNIIFGLSFIFSEKALKISDPLVILSVRFTLSFLFLGFLILIRAVKVNFNGKNILPLIFMSLAQPGIYFIAEIYGIKYTSSAISGIIISLVPVGVIILSSAFLKERPTFFQTVCTVVSVAAVSAIGAISAKGGKNTVLGIILLFIAVISAAAFNILSRKASKEFSPFEKTFFMFFSGSIIYNIIGLLSLKKHFFIIITSSFKNTDFIISVIYLACVSSVAAFMLFNYATSKISPVKSASFSNIITVVSVMAGIFIMHNEINYIQLILCIPAILGVFGVNALDKSNR